MSAKVLKHIFEEIIRAKYFSIIDDPTPDLSHIDQLSIIIRYCLNDKVYERFLTYIPIQSHTGESLASTILQF